MNEKQERALADIADVKQQVERLDNASADLRAALVGVADAAREVVESATVSQNLDLCGERSCVIVDNDAFTDLREAVKRWSAASENALAAIAAAGGAR